MNKIKRDDTVLVVKGKDKGRTGQVRRVIPTGKKTDKFGQPRPGRVIVTGINMVKRHMRPRGPQKPGGIIEREAPIAWANVALVCATCSEASRVGVRALAGGGKTRYCKKCDANID
jgi:large subunit ribosomal protein L24